MPRWAASWASASDWQWQHAGIGVQPALQHGNRSGDWPFLICDSTRGKLATCSWYSETSSATTLLYSAAGMQPECQLPSPTLQRHERNERSLKIRAEHRGGKHR